MSYKIKIEPETVKDIQKIVNSYDDQKINLGKKFYNSLEKAIQSLKVSPYFQIIYDTVRCYTMKKYPFMIHYTIEENEKIITIRAIFHTSQDTDLWYRRTTVTTSSSSQTNS